MMMTVVCYETKEPVFYNKGTEYERTHTTFLSYYTYATIEQAQIEVDRLNTEKPATLQNGQTIDWAKVKRFFVSQQENMF